MWLRLGQYVRIGIPDTWFFGYQFAPGMPPDRNLVICVIPCIALAVNLGKLHHRFTCALCYPSRWRINWWVR
jgi:hypothetical protein